MIKVLLADDQALVRGGFRVMLDLQPDIEVCAEAADGREAVRLTRDCRPHVVLMDLRMPRLDGLEATRAVLAGASPPKVIVLTTFDLDEYVYEALRAGASGYLLKEAEPATLVAAVRGAVDGEMPFSPAVARRLAEAFTARPQGPKPDRRLEELTAREREVLELLAHGLSNAEIAERLVVSPPTVKTHVARLLGKLGVRDRIQAVIFAYESELVRPGQGEE